MATTYWRNGKILKGANLEKSVNVQKQPLETSIKKLLDTCNTPVLESLFHKNVSIEDFSCEHCKNIWEQLFWRTSAIDCCLQQQRREC